MGVVDKILDNKYSLRYYGLNDMATSVHAASLLQKGPINY